MMNMKTTFKVCRTTEKSTSSFAQGGHCLKVQCHEIVGPGFCVCEVIQIPNRMPSVKIRATKGQAKILFRKMTQMS